MDGIPDNNHQCSSSDVDGICESSYLQIKLKDGSGADFTWLWIAAIIMVVLFIAICVSCIVCRRKQNNDRWDNYYRQHPEVEPARRRPGYGSTARRFGDWE